MATRKRRVPAAVQEQLERKQRQTASMAERQGAALGRDAREQLRPLLKARRGNEASGGVVEAGEPPALTFTPKFTMPDLSLVFGRALMRGLLPKTIGIDYAIAPPSIDPTKLEALKTAEPYKVAPRVPDMVEVITGWRGWTLSKCGRLEALGRNTVWPTKRALEAECSKPAMSPFTTPHFPPGWNCTCGIWAFKDLDRLVAAIGSSYGSVRVIGTVSLWGRVIETENGYRAQYAYPAELWLLDDSLEELGRIYDVPVRRAG